MNKQNLSLILLLFFVIAFGFYPAEAQMDPPHNESSDPAIECQSCHSWLPGWVVIPRDEEQETMCRSCHNPTGQAAVMADVANHVVNDGTTIIDCGCCHNAHIISTPADSHAGGLTADNLSLIRSDTAHYFPGALQPALYQLSPDQYSFDTSPFNGICQTCHTQTVYHGNDGTDPTHYAGSDCLTCHPHENGFRHGAGTGTTCADCHGTSGSHSTHLTLNARGPNPVLNCEDCHDPGNYPLFGTSGAAESLVITQVCDNCHSPGGSYDGVDDSEIGAKVNWTDGAYNGSSLKTGKETWCAGCHDEQPANSLADGSGVSASNIVGDEDAVTDFGIGYGYYMTGHGLTPNQTYPTSGDTIPGAGMSCEYCHDAGLTHIDGIARTYEYTAVTGNTRDYQHGYRMKSVGGELPLFIPRTGDCTDIGVDALEFRLCFSCHQSGPFTDPGNMNTNFRQTGTPDVNSHNYHLSIMFACGYGPVYSSDWRSHDDDSRATCMTCHNVHGSTQLSMVRDGKLINREPGQQVLYYMPGVVFDCFTYPDPSDVSLPESTGTIWAQNNSVCSTCHGSCGFDSVYYRLPFESPPPVGTSITLHPSGLNTTVDCTPVGGLWADILDSNDGDTSYADCYSYYDSVLSELHVAQFDVNLDDPGGLTGMTIDSVTVQAVLDVTGITGGGMAYTQICFDTGGAGQTCSSWFDLDGSQTYVEITVSEPLNPEGIPFDLNDLNNLNVEVFLAADDCCGDADATAHVTEVYAEIFTTVTSDSSPPTASSLDPAHGETDVNTFSHVTLTMSDTVSGVDWTTFEIQFAGDNGYSATFTDADFSNVSKTGTPASYDITVNPSTDFNGEELITVTVLTNDFFGNPVTPFVWQFTTGITPVAQSVILYPSDLASSTAGWLTIGGAWSDALDTNDGNTSYAYLCCTAAGSAFYLDLDYPVGLESAVFQSITFHVYARYRTSPGGADIPYAGPVNIGYKTGTNSVWNGNFTTDLTGDFNLISSSTYTTDSDGGTIDFGDINNLQISVQRNAAGSQQIRVTQVYAEIVYFPGGSKHMVRP